MFQIFRDARISSKLLIGFGVVIALLGAVAATNYLSQQRVAAQFNAYASIAENRVRVTELEYFYQKARRTALQAGYSGEAADLNSTLQQLEEFPAKIEIIRNAMLSEERKRAITAIEGRIGVYKTTAQRMSGMETEARLALLNGEMRQISTQIDDELTALSEAQAGAMQQAMDRATAEKDFSEWLAIVIAMAGIGAGLLAAWLIARAIANPVRQMTEAMDALKNGDLTVAVPAQDRRDEIGGMGRSVEVFKQSMIETHRLREEQERMKKTSEAERRQAMLDLASRFEASVQGVVDAVGAAASEMQASAAALSATATETAQQATSVAAATEEASASVQTVASASEELSASIHEIGRQVANSTTIAQNAAGEAQRTNAQVQTLAEAAAKIGEVVRLISEIASQTNLLALNATIEAARAGEAGKGFAVVASEVKTLAAQTAKATDDIAQRIAEIQNATGASVTAIQGIGKTIIEINEISTAIAAAVQEQGAATQEIARNVGQAASGTQEVSSNIAGVTEAANETGRASNQMLGAASELATQAETLRGEVSRFLAQVRAA